MSWCSLVLSAFISLIFPCKNNYYFLWLWSLLSILSFPARTLIISPGYDPYYRYYLLLLSNYHLFLIITSHNQFYFSLQQQLSSPRDYYYYINVIFPWKNNQYSLMILISISTSSFLGKMIIILSWLLSALPISSVPEKKNWYILLIFISLINIIFTKT